MKRSNRGVVLLTCLFLALLLFGLTVVQVARVTFMSQAAMAQSRRLPVELLARSIFNQAFLELRRSPTVAVNRSGAMGGGTYQATTRKLSNGVTELEVRVQLQGLSASVVGSLRRLDPSPVPFYSVRGSRFGGNFLPTFWFPGKTGWEVLPPPTVAANEVARGELQVGVDLGNQPFFLSFPPVTYTTQPNGLPTMNYGPTINGPGYMTPSPAANGIHLHRFEKGAWTSLDLKVPMSTSGLMVNTSRNLILASSGGRVMAYEVDSGSWRQLVPPGEPLVGNMQVDEAGNLYAMTRTTAQMQSNGPMTVARYDGRQWVPLMTGAISDFTPLPSGEVLCQMGLGGSLQKSDGTTIALPPSLSNNVQKHFLTVDRDGRILAELVDRGGGMGNDFRAWSRDEKAPNAPLWAEQNSPNQVYGLNGQLVGGPITSLSAVVEGGNSSTTVQVRKVWEFR